MKKHRLKRVIAPATPSAPDPQDAFDLKFKLAVRLIKLFVSRADPDIGKTAETIRATDLDWTLVRLPFLNHKPGPGNVKADYLGAGTVKRSLARPDLVDFVFSPLEDDTHRQKASAVSH